MGCAFIEAIGRFGPPTPTRAGKFSDASVDPTDATMPDLVRWQFVGTKAQNENFC
jgi:hypothetical protein